MEYDWIGYAAAILIFMYSLWNDAQNRQKRNAASATLVALKSSVQGPNKDKIIAAIDDTFWSASSELSARSRRLPGQFRGAPSRPIDLQRNEARPKQKSSVDVGCLSVILESPRGGAAAG
jgi:hypothetical protein